MIQLRRRLAVMLRAVQEPIGRGVAVVSLAFLTLWGLIQVVDTLVSQVLPETLSIPKARDLAAFAWAAMPLWAFALAFFVAIAVGCVEYAFRKQTELVTSLRPPLPLELQSGWTQPTPPLNPHIKQHPTYYSSGRPEARVFMEGGGAFGDLVNSQAYMTLNDVLAHMGDVIDPKPSIPERVALFRERAHQGGLTVWGRTGVAYTYIWPDYWKPGSINAGDVLPQAPGQPRFITTDGEPSYSDLRVPRAEVYKSWPYPKT